MPKFLIEVAHDATYAACVQAVEIFLRTGSHFLARADWGCKDGVHNAWITVELGSRDEALNIVPAALQPRTRIIQLNAFTLDQLEQMKAHSGQE